MRAGDGHPACPAWEGEGLQSYLERYAKKLGLTIHADPFRRAWPRTDGRTQEQRIDAIMRGERDEPREPGEDG